MSRKFIQFALFFSLVCGSLLGYPFIIGRAQTPATLSNLEVDLWPEYDRPGVLVIYRITLPSGVSLPTDLTLRIPAAAGEPNAIASKQPDGSLLNAAYDRVVNGEWADITLTATMPEIQVEYYDPGITRDGNKRTFAYRWLGDYNVQSFQVQVQQPKDATNLSTSPALGAGVTRDDGLVYYTSNIGQLPAGQAFDITVNYDKASDDLTAANMQVQPSAPVADTAMGWRSQIQAALPWGLLVFGIVLLVGGGVWYWQSGKRKEQSKSPRRRRRSTTATSEPAPAGGQTIYCHSCGKRAGPNDRFCRTCGTKLRLE
jgi:hypothetical protein